MSSSYGENKTFPLDKIFFVLACLYLGFVVAWLVNRRHQQTSQPTLSEISTADRTFIAYLQSSLDVIDRKAKAEKPVTPTNTIPPAVVSVPPPPIITNPYPSPRVIERIYIPVYPQTTPSPKPVITSILPSPPPPSPIAVAPPKIAPLTPTSDRVKNTLVGVLELGDKSAALFDNKGVNSRISIGEFINGWTLVGVQNQQVILSRSGKTRILEVGQSF